MERGQCGRLQWDVDWRSSEGELSGGLVLCSGDVSGGHVDGQSGCLGGIGQSFVVRDEGGELGADAESRCQVNGVQTPYGCRFHGLGQDANASEPCAQA